MKIYLVLLLVSITLSMPVAHSNNEMSEEEVEAWFEKLGHAKTKVTKLHFYLHDKVSGKAPTVLPLALAKNLKTGFGAMMVMDNSLTLGPDPNSKEVGRAQGLYAAVSQEELHLFMSMNLVFTNGIYNGSTLSVSGSNPAFHKHRELLIVGGSGYFRLARGSVLLTTYSFDSKTGNAVVEYQLFVKHY